MAENQSTNSPANMTAPSPGAQGRKKSAGRKTGGGSSRRAAGGIPLLKEQHAEIRKLISAGIEDPEQFARLWSPHTIIEEEILVPLAEEKGVDADILAQAGVERDLVKLLLRDILSDPDGATLAARTKVLGTRALELIDMEEKPRQGLIALAKAAGVDLAEVQRRAVERNNQLNEAAERRSLKVPAPRSLRTWGARSLNHPEEKDEMPRQSNMRDRDDQGRFVSDDEDDRYQGRGGRYSQSSRGNDRERDEQGRFMSDDDDDRYRGRPGRGNGDHGRDEQGRFMSNDDDDRYRGRFGRGNGDHGRDEQGRFMSNDDDDRYRGRSGGNGGNNRERDEQGRFMSDDDRGRSGGSRSSGYSSYGRSDHDDDNRDRRGGGYARGSDYDDDRLSSRGRGQGGWYGDREGHSEASRRGWQQSDRGESGWYGDPEGHSEASRRGWEGRRGSSGNSSRYDERGNGRPSQSRSRGSDYDDDRRSSRGQGQGGWFGDPEGHSEASRRGWEDRR